MNKYWNSEVNALSDKAQKPNIVKSSRLFGDYLIMLIAPAVLAFLYYGERALSVLAVSIGTAFFCDAVASIVLKKTFYLKDLSGIYAGAAIAMMMPAGVPLYIPAFASAFAVLAAKIPFGSVKTPFSPAAAGFAFAALCFKEEIFSYTENTSTKLLGSVSVGKMLSSGNALHLDAANYLDLIGGNVAGPMGTGCTVLMLGCCAYLFVRRRRALLATAGFIAACAVFAAVMPRINAPALTSFALELSAGSLMFAAVFIVTDPSTLPKKSLNRVIYGAVCGIICMGMRYLGAYEEPVCFAVLFANGFRPVIDSLLKRIPEIKFNKKAASVRKEAAANE